MALSLEKAFSIGLKSGEYGGRNSICAPAASMASRAAALVRGEVVEDHNVAGPQRWYQDLLNVGDEAFPGH
jgi:hypothetical protein